MSASGLASFSLSLSVSPPLSVSLSLMPYYSSLYRDDLARAIKKLRILGAGFAVIPMKGGRLVQSVPGELNMDHTAVLQKAEVSNFNYVIIFYYQGFLCRVLPIPVSVL